jgi:hypothetical protein
VEIAFALKVRTRLRIFQQATERQLRKNKKVAGQFKNKMIVLFGEIGLASK